MKSAYIKVKVSCLISFSLLIALGSTGCTFFHKNRIVKAGDPVKVTYTCSLQNGEIISSTRPLSDPLEQGKKASVFFDKKETGPEKMIAGSGYYGSVHGNIKQFKDEINGEISKKIIGLTYGKKERLTIASKTPEGLTDQDRYLTLAKIRKQPKTQKMNRIIFKRRIGKEPEKGMVFMKEGPYKGVVESVEGDDVMVTITIDDGTAIDFPYGKGIVRNSGNHYIIDIDVKKGQLVKMSTLLGRIDTIEDTTFRIDYGNALGGETLICDVIVSGDISGNNNSEANPTSKKEKQNDSL